MAHHGNSPLRRTLGRIRFWGIHVLAIAGALWSGPTVEAAVAGVLFYAGAMFGITGGFHRYFSHRSFKTGRAFQAVLAALGTCAAEQGVLWWAAHHRHHHRHTDEVEDVHSPVQRGFWYSHVGWVHDPAHEATNLAAVRDLAKYPELVWLDRWWVVPPALLAAAAGATMGWSGLFWGFGIPLLALWHATFCVNSVCHRFGSRRFDTPDHSRNNVWVALITFGEGWHNNHHQYMSSTRQGFTWWEVDATYYALLLLQRLGIVWDLRDPPAKVTDQPAESTKGPRRHSA